MENVSNRVIVGLLVVALMVTVVGTMVSVNKLNQLGGTFRVLQGGVLTGAQSGSSNLTINTVTSLAASNNSLTFGTGRVNTTCDFCTMDTNGITDGRFTNGSRTANGTAGQVHSCCTTFTSVINGFYLENTGNTNISVGYTCANVNSGRVTGNCTPVTLIGGTQASGDGGIEIRVAPGQHSTFGGQPWSDTTAVTDTSQSCLGGGTLYRDSNWNITNSSAYTSTFGDDRTTTEYVSISTRGHWLCGNFTNYPLDSDNAKDGAVVDMNLTLPNAVPANGGNAAGITLVFNATGS